MSETVVSTNNPCTKPLSHPLGASSDSTDDFRIVQSGPPTGNLSPLDAARIQEMSNNVFHGWEKALDFKGSDLSGELLTEHRA